MWTPLASVLLVVATGEGIWIAVLLVQRRQVTVALGALQRDVQEVLRAAERASEEQPPSSEPARAIGFRA